MSSGIVDYAFALQQDLAVYLHGLYMRSYEIPQEDRPHALWLLEKAMGLYGHIWSAPSDSITHGAPLPNPLLPHNWTHRNVHIPQLEMAAESCRSHVMAIPASGTSLRDSSLLDSVHGRQVLFETSFMRSQLRTQFRAEIPMLVSSDPGLVRVYRYTKSYACYACHRHAAHRRLWETTVSDYLKAFIAEEDGPLGAINQSVVAAEAHRVASPAAMHVWAGLTAPIKVDSLEPFSAPSFLYLMRYLRKHLNRCTCAAERAALHYLVSTSATIRPYRKGRRTLFSYPRESDLPAWFSMLRSCRHRADILYSSRQSILRGLWTACRESGVDAAVAAALCFRASTPSCHDSRALRVLRRYLLHLGRSLIADVEGSEYTHLYLLRRVGLRLYCRDVCVPQFSPARLRRDLQQVALAMDLVGQDQFTGWPLLDDV